MAETPKADGSASCPLAHPYRRGLKSSAFNSADTALHVTHTYFAADELALRQVSDMPEIRQGI